MHSRYLSTARFRIVSFDPRTTENSKVPWKGSVRGDFVRYFQGWQSIAVYRWSPMIQPSPTGRPPKVPPVVTENSTDSHRWTLMNTPVATDGSTGKKISIPVLKLWFFLK